MDRVRDSWVSRPPTAAEADAYSATVRGCLLGGAIGDALGAPVGPMTREAILAVTGQDGVRAFLPVRFGSVQGAGLITGDTQMTLFVTEGIIRARVREDRGLGLTVGVTHHALLRWLDTQVHSAPTGRRDGWLIDQRWLYSRRNPGRTCLSALPAADAERFGEPAMNDSKGCGSVARSAPFGLLAPAFGAEAAYRFAAESAGYTHGHRIARTTSGALAYLVAQLVDGADLPRAVDATIGFLAGQEPDGETLRALVAARRAASESDPDAAVASLGRGWVAEEALAIAVHCALRHPEPDRLLDALTLAVTHSGNSNATGSICGSILGAAHGAAALPPPLVYRVEGRGTLLELADDLVLEMTAAGSLHGDYGPDTGWTDRYPGW